MVSNNSKKLKLINRSGVKWLAGLIVLLILAMKPEEQEPSLFIIGDSTVKNGKGDGSNGQWGWGSVLPAYFDTTQLKIENHALGGTSTRTYLTKGLWQGVIDRIKKGDYLIMQFGHNDGGPLDDTARARGTLKGVGPESKEIFNPITKEQELVYTYGWYITKFVDEAKAKGATVIICSPIPRNQWRDHRIIRSVDSYAQWAEEVAKREQVQFINLNNLIADDYDRVGEVVVQRYFPSDHTHTNLQGAKKNAEIIVEALKLLPIELKKYLTKK